MMQNHIATPQRRALNALSIAYFIQATGSLSVAGSLAAISHEWGLSDAQSARLLSIFGLTFALRAAGASDVRHVDAQNAGTGRHAGVRAGGGYFCSRAELHVAGYFTYRDGAWRVADRSGTGGAWRGVSVSQRRGSAIAMILLGVSMASMVGIPLAAWIAHAWGARILFALVALISLLTAGVCGCWCRMW
jgi:hypothetical protein